MKDNSKEGLSSFDENKNHAIETKGPAMSRLRSKATPAVCCGRLSPPARTETKQGCRKKVQNFKQSAGFCSCRHTLLKTTLVLMPMCSAVTSKGRLSLNPKASFNLEMTLLQQENNI